MRVVVIGGGGQFGARICRRLSQESALTVIAAGRHASAATDAAVPHRPLDLDASDFAAELGRLAPDVVIHCAGPYQDQDYRVVGAALACRAHYIDLADGRDFVVQFAAQNHSAALAAARVAVTGASTLPALSSAVADHLAANFAQVDEIEVVIAPGQRAPRGRATVAAVLSYAGRGFRCLQEGRWRTLYGWQSLRRMHFRFGPRYTAVCDVPDLSLLVERYPGVRTVMFRAALEVPLLHYGLWCVAGLRRIGVPVPAPRWAGTLSRIVGWLDRFGSDRGGMTVSVEGRDASGSRRRAIWQLVAQSNHGPEIPCMASVLMTRKLAAGDALPHGARACMGLVTLSDFESEFSRWDIRTWIEWSVPDAP